VHGGSLPTYEEGLCDLRVCASGRKKRENLQFPGGQPEVLTSLPRHDGLRRHVKCDAGPTGKAFDLGEERRGAKAAGILMAGSQQIGGGPRRDRARRSASACRQREYEVQ